MKTVNSCVIDDLIGSTIGGSADIENEYTRKLALVDGNKEKEVKEMMIVDIKPFFSSASIPYKSAVKRSLSYFLTSNSIDFGRLYDSNLIAFDHPNNPRDFFVWLWQVLFPEINYIINNVDEFTVIYDSGEPSILYSKSQ